MTRDELIASAMNIPRHEARKRNIPRYFDDLRSVGLEALVIAADSYDPERNIKFRGYAESRIRWAMQEYLRKEDPLGRDIRNKVKQGFIDDPMRVLVWPTEQRPIEENKFIDIAANIDAHYFLSGLNPFDHEIMKLRYWDEETFTEIGAIIGRHNSQVCRHHDRILKTLRKKIR